jgi:hypothetical protein
MTVRRLFVLSMAIPLAAMAIAVGVATPRSDAEATVDMSGTWELTVRGLAAPDLDEECTAVVTQDASTMTIDLDCERSDRINLTGSSSPNGSFSVLGEFFSFDIVFFGHVDGDTMSGKLSWRDGWGTFDGVLDVPDVTRTPTPIGPFDPAGDWLIKFDGRNVPRIASGGTFTCIVYMDVASTIAGASSCSSFGSSKITGNVDVETETLSIDFTNELGTFALSGIRDEEGLTVGSYTLSVFPDVVNKFRMSRLRTNYWGNKVCSPDIRVFVRPTIHVFGESAAAIDALRVAAGISGATPSNYSCNVILDVNLDNRIDGRDAMLILQNEAGLTPRLPIL